MRLLFYLLTVFVFVNFLNAQQSKPKNSISNDSLNTLTEEKNKFKFFGLTQFTFNQAYFENWVSGGENSTTGLLSIDYKINYMDEKGWVWDNNLMLSIGTTYLSSKINQTIISK